MSVALAGHKRPYKHGRQSLRLSISSDSGLLLNVVGMVDFGAPGRLDDATCTGFSTEPSVRFLDVEPLTPLVVFFVTGACAEVCCAAMRRDVVFCAAGTPLVVLCDTRPPSVVVFVTGFVHKPLTQSG